MKSAKITHEVMNKVMEWERNRVYKWIAAFGVMVSVLVAMGGAAGWSAGQKIGERKTLDLVQIFGEDKEIVADYWQDGVRVFWEELPKADLAVGWGAVGIVVMAWLITAKKRKIVRQKLKQVIKYHQ